MYCIMIPGVVGGTFTAVNVFLAFQSSMAVFLGCFSSIVSMNDGTILCNSVQAFFKLSGDFIASNRLW